MVQRRRFLPDPKAPLPKRVRAIEATDVVADLRNPYVRWAVSGHNVLPWPIDWKMWRDAAAIVVKRARHTLQRFNDVDPTHLTWSDYERFDRESQRFEHLLAWGRFAAFSEPANVRQAFNVWSEDLTAALNQDVQASGLKAVLDRWGRPKCRGVSEEEKQRLQREFSLEGVEAPDLADLFQPLKAALRHLESIRNRDLALAQGVLIQDASVLELLDKESLKEARQKAAASGQSGWLFLPRQPETLYAMGVVHDRVTREALWRHEQAVTGADQEDAVAALHVLKMKIAERKGFASFASFQLRNSIEKSSVKLDRWLADGLRQMKPMAKKARVTLERFARRHGNIEAVHGWDVSHLMGREGARRSRREVVLDDNVFPVLPTLDKMIPELMAIGGWSVLDKVLHGSTMARVMCWTLRHQDGRKAHLWVDVYAQQAEEIGAAEAFAMRGMPFEPMAGVHLAIDPNIIGMSHRDLEVIAHELGHVLHELANSEVVRGSYSTFPWSVAEVPSILMQQYVYDPSVLVRWAAPKAAPKFHTTAFWKRWLKSDPWRIIYEQEEWFLAWLDLRIHRMAEFPKDLNAFVRDHRAAFGLMPLDDEDRSVWVDSWWDNQHYWANRHAYAMSSCFVQHLLGEGFQFDHRASAKRVAEMFELLQENVLHRVGPVTFEAAWRHWRHESCWEALCQGRDRYLADVIDKSKALPAYKV